MSHALPVRYVIDASDGRFPAARIDHVGMRCRSRSTRRWSARPRRCAPGRRRRGSSMPTAMRPRPPTRHLDRGKGPQSHRDVAGRRAGPAGRRRDLPRLRRSRFDLSLARIRRLGYDRGGARSPRRAGRAGGSRCRALRGGVRCLGRAPRRGDTEAELREVRYAATAALGLRATGHTASDQVETVLLRLLASGSTRGIRPGRVDGVVRPSCPVWREETHAYCAAHGLPARTMTNADTKRGLLRSRVLPLLEEIDPRARASLYALGEERPRLPRRLESTLVELLSSLGDPLRRPGERGSGDPGVRRASPRGTVSWGPWRLSSERTVSWSALGAPGTGSPDARRRCRISSWTPRSLAPIATPGRSSRQRAATSWGFRASPSPRLGGRLRATRRPT